MKKLSTGLFMVFIFFSSGVALSQEQGGGNHVFFENGKESTRIPFADDFGLIFLELSLNDSQLLSFVLDTGFDTNIVNASLPKRLGIELKNRQIVAQPGGEIEMGEATDLTFKIGGVTLKNQTAMTAPLSSLAPIIGRPFDGILGHDFISQFVVEIDYEKKQISLYDPKTFRYVGSGESIPVTVVQREPFVTAEIAQPNRPSIQGKFKIDTGSMDAIGLNNNFFVSKKVLSENQKTIEIPGIATGGETAGMNFRISGFKIGNHELVNLVIGVTTDSAGFENRADAGTLGGEILTRFKVILDYKRNRMILEKRKNVIGLPFESDMSGLRLVTSSNDFESFKISNVAADSPASEAGFQEDDIVLSINNKPIGSFKLSEIWEMFRQKEGQTFHIEIQRSGQKMKKTIKLRRLI